MPDFADDDFCIRDGHYSAQSWKNRGDLIAARNAAFDIIVRAHIGVNTKEEYLDWRYQNTILCTDEDEICHCCIRRGRRAPIYQQPIGQRLIQKGYQQIDATKGGVLYKHPDEYFSLWVRSDSDFAEPRSPEWRPTQKLEQLVA